MKITVNINRMTTAESAVHYAVFFTMFAASCYYAVSAAPWFALIPAIAAIAHWNMIRDKKNIEKYRYADWLLTTPLMLLAVLNQNNVTTEFIQITLILDTMMIAAGYFGINETDKNKKVAWFTLGCLLFLPILYILINLPIEKQAATFLAACWTLYPAIWLLKSNYILQDDATNIAYSVLDVVTKIGLLSQIHI